MPASKKPNSPSSRASISRTITVNSYQAHRVMHRSLDRLRRALFSISVILPIIVENDEELEEIDAYIDNEFSNLEKSLLEAQARARKILEDAGIEEVTTYSNPIDYTVEVDSPRINVFLRLIIHLDTLINLIDTTWLSGEIDDKQKKIHTYQWQQRLIRLAGRISGLENKARAAAKKKGKDSEVQEQAPEHIEAENDTEMLKVIKEEETEISKVIKDEKIPISA